MTSFLSHLLSSFGISYVLCVLRLNKTRSDHCNFKSKINDLTLNEMPCNVNSNEFQ